MKKRFLAISKTNGGVFVWIFFHAAILLSFLISLVASPKIQFATSLFEILPPSSSLHEIQAADSALAAKTGQSITILVKSPSFETAKSDAEQFYSRYVDSANTLNTDYFDSLSLYIDSSSVTEITDWLHENRFVLLDDETCALLETGRASEIAEEAVASVYGAFTLSELSKIEEDPFLLTERNLKKMLEDGAISSTALSLKDDVLACEKDGYWYVLIRGIISEKGSSLTGKKSTVTAVREECEKIQNQHDSAFIFSGVPFHSYENATSAQRQISVISTVALVLIVAVFLWIFRSAVPAIVSALAVAFSCAIGFVSTLLFFRGIHVLTFVFGTTLIGTCLDYSIHYFVNWRGNTNCKNGKDVRNHIFRGISLGFISTEICFLALFFAPFPLLKQVSVFLFTGLATAYLSVVTLYPLLKMPKVTRRTHSASQSQNGRISVSFVKKNTRLQLFVPVILACFSLIVIGIQPTSLKIKNNIQELYSMSPQMLQNEITSAQVLNTGSSGWYFILKGDSEESLLQKNEELGNFLDSAVHDGKLGSFLSVTQFVPSQKKQLHSFTAAKNLLPLAKNQYNALGIGSAQHSFETLTTSHPQNFVHPSDSQLPRTIKESISNLWIGEIDGAFYSCVLPLHATKEAETFFRDYCAKTEGVYFVNKVQDISQQLDILSKSMLKMLCGAFLLVIVILFFCYKPRLVFKIASVPLLVTLVTTAILILCKIHLSFFPITALILVFGLGLDYIIYAIEGEHAQTGEESLNKFAILLSFVTTALSFGALTFSTFPPVHMLGLTVFAGLTTALASAFSMSK